MNKWLVAILIVFLPNIALASFSRNSKSLQLEVGNTIFRLRSVDRPWQLSTFRGNGLVSFQDKVLATSEGGELYYSVDGLGFLPVLGVPKTALAIKVTNNFVVAYGQAAQGLYVSRDGMNFSAYDGLEIDGERLENIIETNGRLNYFLEAEGNLNRYELVNSAWIRSEESYLATISATGQNILVATDLLDRKKIYLWSDNAWRQFLVTEDIAGAKIVKQRVFLDTISGLRELDWNNSQITEPIVSGEANVLGDDISGAVVITASQTYLSAKPGYYQSISPPFSFDRLLSTGTGYIFYQTGGSRIYFSPNGQTFNESISSWSASANIRSVALYDRTALVELENSSQKTNIYRSDDYLNWKKITLPVKPTHRVTIDEARGLSPNDLVEISGYQSILPNVVSSNVIYLQDDTGGIQIYLSSSIGNLPSVLGRKYLIDGEISETEAKRIIVSAENDIYYLGERQTPKWLEVPFEDLGKYQGQLVKTQGKIIDTRESVANVISGLFSSAVHYSQASDILKPNDLVGLSGVVDWNSSSQRTELWYDQHTFELISRPEIPVPIIEKTDQLSTGTSVNATTDTHTMTTTLREVPILIEQPQVAYAKALSDQTPSWPLLILGFSTGLIVARGKRF